MKKIAIISSQGFSILNFRGDLIQDLVKNKNIVYTLAPDFTNKMKNNIEVLGAKPVDIKMSRTGINPLVDFINFIFLIHELNKLNPDIVIVYFIKPVIYGTLASWIIRVKKRIAIIEGLGLTFSFNNYNSLKKRVIRKIMKTLYKISLSKAHNVFFLNCSDMEYFLEEKLIDKKQSFMIGAIGVNLNEWFFEKEINKEIVFMLAARLLKEKGVYEFVEAAKQIKKIHKKTRFIILGDVDKNPNSVSKKDLLEWSEKKIIEWPGHVDVKKWIGKSSVFVLPSYYREGVPRSIQEAMSKGRAIITTNLPGCRETVEEGANGYLIKPKDINSLKDAMLRFINKPQLIQKMGIRSRKIAEERFDVKKINKKIMKIIL